MVWFPKETVLVPIDFSEASVEALSVARDTVAEQSGLRVAHVLSVAEDYDENVFHGQQRHEEHRRSIADQLKQLLEEQDLPGARPVVLEDRGEGAGKTIAHYAEELAADLIVIPTHGYSGLERLLMGSVAEQVARHAPCPVLLFHRGGH